MTLDIALVLAILAVALVLFITEWVRMDLVALLLLPWVWPLQISSRTKGPLFPSIT